MPDYSTHSTEVQIRPDGRITDTEETRFTLEFVKRQKAKPKRRKTSRPGWWVWLALALTALGTVGTWGAVAGWW